ncbi:MAG: DUF2378 family protein [Myxococcaceae bacterium]|nr:DUF2378 family protein [Myxococcaceae bacterium]
MDDQRLVFSHTAEGLFVRGLKADQHPALKARLKALGLDLDGKLRPAYTYAEWCTFLDAATQELFPGVPKTQALFTIGEQLIDGYFSTMVGKALLGLVKIMGPKRTLARMKQNFRTGNSYSESTLTEHGPGHYTLWLNETDDYRPVTQGLLQRGLMVTGAKGLEVKIARFDEKGTDFEVRWTP